MLESLITSATRIKLLLKFFLNSSTTAYLRGLAEEFHESTNSIRIELNRFEQAGLLTSKTEGNKKVYAANTNHPLYTDIHSILLKHTGVDQIIAEVISKLGNLVRAYLVGEMANGRDCPLIDIILVGQGIDTAYLSRLNTLAEEMTGRKIRTLTIKPEEEQFFTRHEKHLLLWENESQRH